MLASNYQKYQQNSVLTASPRELTLMLYNGGIKFCNIGIKAIEEKKYEQAHKAITRAQDIIIELKCTLNEEYPVAEGMSKMYDYILDILILANTKKDCEKLQEAKSFITEFRDMWHEAMKLAK